MSTDLKEAREAFQHKLDAVLKLVKHGSYKLCLTYDENFRKSIYPDYKGNRKKMRKPMGFKPFRQTVRELPNVVLKPKLEADDCIGILATKPGNDCIIFSGDKDLKQIPGKHLVDGEVKTILPEAADYWFWQQILTGDAVDGYPGCPGIGPKKAQAILHEALDGLGSMQLAPTINYVWPYIKKTYEAATLTEANALTQARCARILRWDDWDMKKQEVRLWTP